MSYRGAKRIKNLSQEYKINQNGKAFQFVISSTVKILSDEIPEADIHAATTKLWWLIDTAPVLVTFDGTNPAASPRNGGELAKNDKGFWLPSVMRLARMRRVSTTDSYIYIVQMM